MNQAEYLGELHQAITEYQGAVKEASDSYQEAILRAGGILRRRLDTAVAAFLGNSHHDNAELREVTR